MGEDNHGINALHKAHRPTCRSVDPASKYRHSMPSKVMKSEIREWT
jgi:hypothetical protein